MANHPPPLPRHPGRAAAVSALLLACLAHLFLPAPAALAHGGRMRAEVSTEPGSAPLSLVITARLSFPDGHPVAGLPVEISASTPGESPVATVPASPAGDPGTYAATLAFPAPGAWTVAVKAGVNEAGAVVEVAEASAAPPAAAADATPTPPPAAPPSAPPPPAGKPGPPPPPAGGQ